MRVLNAFKSIKNELLIFSISTVIFIYVSSIGIYYFENSVQPDQFSFVFDCMWWSIITLTSVGYGDMYPITSEGDTVRIFTVIIGMGIIAIPTGLIASALTGSFNKNKMDADS